MLIICGVFSSPKTAEGTFLHLQMLDGRCIWRIEAYRMQVSMCCGLPMVRCRRVIRDPAARVVAIHP
jgi:hypothetical protein